MPSVTPFTATADAAAIWARLAGIAALAPVLALLAWPGLHAGRLATPLPRSGFAAAGVGVGVGAGLAGVWVAVIALLSPPASSAAPLTPEVALTLSALLLAGAVLALQAASEELLFRRLAPRAFQALGAPLWLWLAAPALLFAAVHYPPQPTDPVGAAAWARLIAAALFFAALAQSRFGLLAAIAAHAMLNAAALTGGGASDANDPRVAAGGAALFLVMAAMVAGLDGRREARCSTPRKAPPPRTR